jgi:tripartite-type tricarboxylate transporter receptor subunit TctC
MRTAIRKAEKPPHQSAPHGNERRLETQHPRRRILNLAAGAMALPAVSRFAWAQAYPTRPVRIILGFGAGGVPDVPARLMAQWLSERLGQQFIVENRPGAGGNIGMGAVVRAPADGYTLGQATIASAWNKWLYSKLNFDFVRDIAPIASIYRSALVLIVHPSLPATTVPEFIAYAKAHPGQINIASSGIGSGPHLACELLKIVAGVDLIQVHYRGAPLSISAVLAGEVQGYFATLPPSIDLIRTGKVRALAVTTATRLDALPNIPAVGDFLPGYEMDVWGGIGAPRNTPTAITEKLNKEINAGLADPRIKARFADLGLAVYASSTSDFSKLIADETDKWGKVIRAANIKAD